MRRRTILGGLLLASAALTAAACSNSQQASNATEHGQAAAGINLLLANQPVPVFPTSALRKNMIEVEAIQALGSPTTTFFFPMGAGIINGKWNAPPFKICASEGEPIHATDSLSNPHQVVPGYNSGSDVVDQMDPNGIYAGASQGTYVLCLQNNGQPKMSYWEGPVETESGVAAWNASTGTINDEGPSQLPVCTVLHAQSGDGTNLKPGTPYYHCVKA